tara:strand:+ start:402 stop:650 length:249 start_codon:yes stop_codon:yes gene_type:complete
VAETSPELLEQQNLPSAYKEAVVQMLHLLGRIRAPTAFPADPYREFPLEGQIQEHNIPWDLIHTVGLLPKTLRIQAFLPVAA